MGIAADRSPSHGALYNGWGEASRGVLNHTCTLLDEASNRGMNRYELAKVIARRAKENAYPAEDESTLLPALGSLQHAAMPKPSKGAVLRSLEELSGEMLREGAVLKLEDEDEEGAEGGGLIGGEAAPLDEAAAVQSEEADEASLEALLARTPLPHPLGAEAAAALGELPPPLAPLSSAEGVTSLDGDGGLAALNDINERLRSSSFDELENASKAEGGAAAGEGATDDLEALLATLGIDDDFDDEEGFDGLDAAISAGTTLFGDDEFAADPLAESQAAADAAGSAFGNVLSS